MLAGCADFPLSTSGPAVNAPEYRVGDRWVYRGQDGFLTPVHWEETWEVTAMGAQGIDVRVTQRGPSTDGVRMERWTAPGRVAIGALYENETRRFKGDLDRYAFPLESGKTWNQWLDNYNESARKEGTINRWVTVRGWKAIATPAGTFDAIGLRVYMHLDDEEFWRERTDCSYLVWYAPAVRASVREEKQAQYLEKSGKYDTAPYRTQNAVVELVGFTAG